MASAPPLHPGSTLAWRWLLAGAALGPTAVVVLACATLAATTPFHDPDDGANLAGVRGFFLSPFVAAGTSGYLATRHCRRRPVLNGLLAAFVSSLAAGSVVAVPVALDAPEYRSETLAATLVVSLVHTAVGLAGVGLATKRRRRQERSRATAG